VKYLKATVENKTFVTTHF